MRKRAPKFLAVMVGVTASGFTRLAVSNNFAQLGQARVACANHACPVSDVDARHKARHDDAARLRLSGRVQAPGQQALLGVQPVFRLVEHHRLRPVHHLVGDLLAAMGRQAMHEQRVGLGLRHQAGIDLVALEHVVARLGVAVAHRHPGVGDHAVGILDRGFRVLADFDGGARLFHPVHQPFLRA